MPFPNEETQFKPGQSGNPEGYSRGRRIQDRLIRIIEEKGLEDQVCLALIAKALGRKDLLKDPKTGEQREPALEWWDRLVGMVDGPAKDVDSSPDSSTVDPQVAAAMIAAGLEAKGRTSE